MRFSLICIVCLMVGLCSCKKGDYSKVEIYGHAGNGLNTQSSPYMQNSLESIELALGTEGVAGVEIDVQLSADGDLWVFHDDELQHESSGSGCINSQTSQELEGIHYQSLNKEKVIRLSELNFGNYSGKKIMIDARHYNVCTGSFVDADAYVARLAAIRDQFPSVQFEVTTRWSGWINDFKAAGFVVYFEYEESSEILALDQDGIVFDGVVIRNSGITADEVTAWHNLGKKVVLFDVRAPKTARKALKKKPDGIITDELKTILIEKS